MKKVPIESIFLVKAIKSLFPLAEYQSVGMFGKLFFVDFQFPFQLNSEILIRLQECLIGEIKKRPDVQVHQMLPKIAKDFLNHHAQKQLGDQVDLELPLISIIKLDESFFISEHEISSSSPLSQVKLTSFSSYQLESGEKFDRIYGISASDSQSLKKDIKAITPFFKINLEEVLNSKKLLQVVFDNIYLKEKGMLEKQHMQKLIIDAFAVLKVDVAEGSFFDHANDFAVINFDSFIEINGPKYQVFLESFENKLAHFQTEKNIPEDLLEIFFEKFIHHFSAKGFNLKIEWQKGKECKDRFEKLLSKCESVKKDFKGKFKSKLTLKAYHPLGLEIDLLKLHFEDKEQSKILKIEIFLSMPSYLWWSEDFILSR